MEDVSNMDVNSSTPDNELSYPVGYRIYRLLKIDPGGHWIVSFYSPIILQSFWR